MMKQALILGVAAVLGGACVSSAAYERKVAEFETFKREEGDRVRAARRRMLALEEDAAKLRGRLREAERSLGSRTVDLEDTRRSLLSSSAEVSTLKKRLDDLGQDVGKLAAERGELSATLALSRARLEELRAHAVAAEERAQVFRDLSQKLHGMIDAGQLKVVVRQGRMLIALPSDVLFESGKTVVRKPAEATLVAVAGAIREIRDRKFLVVGHTDNLPIHTARFPSNWELSTGRAIAVARVLMAQGLAPSSVGVGGQAEFEPVAANDTPAHRLLNRRIEIVLEPKLADLPAIPTADAPVSLR